MPRSLSGLDLATFDDPFDHPVKQSEKEGEVTDSMGLPLHFIPCPRLLFSSLGRRRGLQNFSAKGDSRGKSFLRIIPSPRTGTNSCRRSLARSDSANVTRAGKLFLYSTLGRKTRGLNSIGEKTKKAFPALLSRHMKQLSIVPDE